MVSRLDRRRFLLLSGGAAAAAGLAACVSAQGVFDSPQAQTVVPTDPAVAQTERARPTTGAVRSVDLRPAPSEVLVAGRTAAAWTYGGRLPGPEIRVRAGDTLEATLSNGLPDPTTIHWHGLALRNDMDGVPGITQDPVRPGDTFTYRFIVPHPGTYFFHPHTGVQLDRGLYAPLVVEDPEEPGNYDREIVLMLDDWLDPEQGTADEVLDDLQPSEASPQDGDMGGMGDMGDMGGMGDMGDMGGMDHTGGGMATPRSPLGRDTGDVTYARYLINGRDASDPEVFRVRRGDRIRFRLINAGSDTPFRVGLAGHRITVTHTDGFPVEPVETDSLIIGMGERYDLTATITDGTFPLVASAEGKEGQALAIVTTEGRVPPASKAPAPGGHLLGLDELRADASVRLPRAEPDRSYEVIASGNMTDYAWRLAAEVRQGVTLPVEQGERVRMRFRNASMMWHPIHLHGHTFQVVTGGIGPRKDTVALPPMGQIDVDVEMDNPGLWAIHCHNIYHAESGMMTVMSYVR